MPALCHVPTLQLSFNGPKQLKEVQGLESKLKSLQEHKREENSRKKSVAITAEAVEGNSEEQVSKKRVITREEISLQKDFRDLKKQAEWWKARFKTRDAPMASLPQQENLWSAIRGSVRQRRQSVVVADPKWAQQVLKDGQQEGSFWNSVNLMQNEKEATSLAGEGGTAAPPNPGKTSKWNLLKHSLVSSFRLSQFLFL
jgi:hypothetical protein